MGVTFEDRQDLLGHQSEPITAHYSSAKLQNLYGAANRVCVPRQSGVVLTLLRNPNSRPSKKASPGAQLVAL